jgi:DNA-binding NarL/FixJ family response regulator
LITWTSDGSVRVPPLESSLGQRYCGMLHESQDVSSLPTKHSRSRILVIDDGDSVRDVIGIFLEHAGFEVCGEAADGVEAIEQAKKLNPDLIVLDLAMPRMNGAEAASILSQTMPEVPIVLLTLYQNLLGSALASAVGIRAVLDKTEGLDKLVACVRSLLQPAHTPST